MLKFKDVVGGLEKFHFSNPVCMLFYILLNNKNRLTFTTSSKIRKRKEDNLFKDKSKEYEQEVSKMRTYIERQQTFSS